MYQRSKSVHFVMLSVLVLIISSTALATNWYVSPSGSSSNSGTYASPWDLGSALLYGHSGSVQPGDSILLLDGNYPETFTTETYMGNPRSYLCGTPSARITIQPEPNATHVRICGIACGDVENYGGGNVYFDCNNIDIKNIEFCSSQWIGDVTSQQTGPWPSDVPSPAGGANFFCGMGVRLINCVIHAGSEGISSWQEMQGFTAYGNDVYGNGWNAPDRGHGHCIYSQNGDPNGKYYTNNLLTTRYAGQLTCQCYGTSDANMIYFWVQNNIAYSGVGAEFMVGGGGPGDHEHMLNNALYGCDFWAGYSLGSTQNQNYEVKNNIVVDGILNYFSIQYLDASNNVVYGSGKTRMWAYPQPGYPNNTYSDSNASA